MLNSLKNIFFGVLISLPYLSSSNQVHAESITHKISSYPAFCKKAAENDEVFANFRREGIYIQVLEHASFPLGKLYASKITTDFPELTDLECFRENDLYGNPFINDYGQMGFFSANTLRYLCVACDLRKKFGDLSNMHIVEIGSGYGGQCKIISDLCGFASYTVIDLPESIALTKKYLEKLGVENVYYIDSEHLSDAQTYDLVISNYAFSEIDRKEQQNYLEHIIKPTPNGYMIMNFISGWFHLESYSLEELVQLLDQNQRISNLEAENPSTAETNRLLTWYPNDSSN